ncbi:extracellular catalytic domain type 1 short-chain-length polyhydroxyalkanoate depolymerase [Streptacidiphilus albus]|uniref:extracellular catalytic domain type 1 short-chain-length polyhydroxyalkanoate depolymerase n=1 Tax=Streptacidiphilus albus TaxID=105425 RepID=UPI00054C467F|nr:PHB depolymerase family esterase [Streptacidiphilus albus]
MQLSLRRRLFRGITLATVTGLLAAGLGLVAASAPASAATGSFQQVTSFGSNPGALQMYSYVSAAPQAAAPLVVALHGCTQTATEYEQDSGWQQYADQWGFDMVYPQQTSSNNSLECFDFFDPSQDARGNGGAASVVQMVQYMEAHYSIDPSRVYVTGLSAGGGLTSELLADYPDVFAGGAIDSGLPAQCATGGSNSAYTCMDGAVNNTEAQWTSLVTNSDPGYTGHWPRVAIWQGTSDTEVNPANATEEMDQWTGVWGISQTASSTQSLTGGTTESVYNDATGKPAVELYAISGMGHGLAVNPGSGTGQCGTTGAYFLQAICSSYYTALFWGLNNTGSTASPTPTPSASASASTSASPTPTPTASASASASPTPTPSASSTPLANCWTTNNVAQNLAGRSYFIGTESYAIGSNEDAGAYSSTVISSIQEPSPGYWTVVPHC